tara:strand:+ start:101 stop:337 length:237 start_codon:yes stop_codon:yes gene_type:complete
MFAKVIMFLGEILLNLRVVIDEIVMFFTNLAAFSPYLALKAFLNYIRYDEYKIIYWIIIIIFIGYIFWVLRYEKKKFK